MEIADLLDSDFQAVPKQPENDSFLDRRVVSTSKIVNFKFMGFCKFQKTLPYTAMVFFRLSPSSLLRSTMHPSPKQTYSTIQHN